MNILKRVFLNPNGSINYLIEAPLDITETNTNNSRYIDVDYIPAINSYWDYDLHSFVNIGDSPSIFHIFDYNFKEWVDPRSLQEIKDQKWIDIKNSRTVFEFGGFDFNGDIYDSDQISQGRIMGAAMAGVDQVWTLKDNTTKLLTSDQLKQLYSALLSHIALVHERGRIAREAVYAASTKEEVEAVVF